MDSSYFRSYSDTRNSFSNLCTESMTVGYRLVVCLRNVYSFRCKIHRFSSYDDSILQFLAIGNSTIKVIKNCYFITILLHITKLQWLGLYAKYFVYLLYSSGFTENEFMYPFGILCPKVVFSHWYVQQTNNQII